MANLKVGFNTGPLKSGHQYRGIGYHTKYLLDELKLIKEIDVKEIATERDLKDLDIIHQTSFDLFKPTLKVTGQPTVVTIHDVIPLVFPSHYPIGVRGKLALRHQLRQLRKVQAIITLSENAKEDIVRYLGVDPKIVHPIYLGVGSQFRQIDEKTQLDETRDKYKLPSEFAVYVGNVNWNKNLLNMTEACLQANMPLVLIGKSFTELKNLDHPELKSFQEFLRLYDNHPSIIKLGFLENEEMAKIVNLATVSLLPSYYEGFGLPIIEAQACGVPVVTSQISSMPEVAGQGAVLVDPYNSTEIAESIIKLKEDKKFRHNQIQSGLKNSQQFSWKNTALQTMKVYKNVKR